MAKPIKLKAGKQINFSKATGGGAASKYAWDEWFNAPDGAEGWSGLLMLEKDATSADGKHSKRDYDVNTDAMPPKIKTAARRRYKVVQVSRVDADGKKLGDALIIRARDMTAEERVAEDIKRAEEKAAKNTTATTTAPATTQPSETAAA